jgi:hypothetical protein
MVIRNIAIALVGAALLAGCGSDTASAPSPSASPTPTASDEEQIRDLLTKATEATSTWDAAKMAGLSCDKYSKEEGAFEGMVPPISTFPADTVATMGPEAFANGLTEQFAGASPESTRAVADAVIANDEAAYKKAMTDVMKQSMTLRLDKVDNIVVTGDTATADVTVTAIIGGQQEQTQSDKAELVKEDGEWKDCTPAPAA